MKIFYSWQTDTEERICKTLIHTALDEAASVLSEKLGENLSIEHDTNSVLGSPNIVDVIKRKIEESLVFVADVTLTGSTLKPGGTKKKQINSNVAVELGYALGVHSDEVVVKVMNEYYGDPKELPFDVQERHPVRFTLAPTATKSELRKVRSDLQKQFEKILSGHYDNWKSHPSRQPVPFEPRLSTVHRGAYWDDSRPLVDAPPDPPFRDRELKLQFSPQTPVFYLRFSPIFPMLELSNADMRTAIHARSTTGCLAHSGGFTPLRNYYGYVSITLLSHASENMDFRGFITQLFPSREIWGVAAYIFGKDEYSEDICFPLKAFRERFSKSLKMYSELAKLVGYSEAKIEAGLVLNVTNYRCFLGRSQISNLMHKEYFQNDFHLERTLELNKSALDDFHDEFIDKIHDEAGV